MNAIEINNLTKEYKDFKLDDISLTLPSGYIMGLIGENGAGKSTTIKLLLNAINADKGEIMTSRNTKGPGKDWINMVNNNSSKVKIRKWFKDKEFEEKTKERGRVRRTCI